MEAKAKRGVAPISVASETVRLAKAPTKYTIVLNERQDDRLAGLAKRLGMTKAEIIRKAVGLLDVIVKESTEPGKSLEVVDKKNGTRTKLVVDLM